MKVKIEKKLEKFDDATGELLETVISEEIVEMPEAEVQKLIAMTEVQQ